MWRGGFSRILGKTKAEEGRRVLGKPFFSFLLEVVFLGGGRMSCRRMSCWRLCFWAEDAGYLERRERLVVVCSSPDGGLKPSILYEKSLVFHKGWRVFMAARVVLVLQCSR